MVCVPASSSHGTAVFEGLEQVLEEHAYLGDETSASVLSLLISDLCYVCVGPCDGFGPCC